MTFPPRATYRVQLHAGFTLDDARQIVPYLADLGISHLYCSPVLQALSGSTHGYDVVDHSRVSDELGGAAAFERLTDELRARDMGLVLDIVPNHMAIGEANRWWWNLLTHGRASGYAGHFDIDWDPPAPGLRDRVLLTVLPDELGRVLASGGIRLVRDGGTILVVHGEQRFPLDPCTTAGLIGAASSRAGSSDLARVSAALADLPPRTDRDPERVARRQREADALADRLGVLAAGDGFAAAIDREIAVTNADPAALGDLLEAQPYRLASWRAASRDLNYRRFFDVDRLIGLRIEDPAVFADTHELILGWVAEGRISGLRIDHPDGLRDPAGYLARLRAAAPGAWIVAEKILEADEPLPDDWPIEGTTGYRFANLATGALVDRDGEEELTALWASVADAGPDWETIVVEARGEVLASILGSDVNRLTARLLAVNEASADGPAFGRDELEAALRAVAAAMPVYRTYVRAADRFVSDRDARIIREATERAAERHPDLDPQLFVLLRRVLGLELDEPAAAELAMDFQQLTPAAMAKGVEDTAFYRHHRLVALNEVGGDPGRFGVAAEAFHAAIEHEHEEWPRAMLALSTHDTKRSADVRARLAVLAEDPGAWRTAVARLTALSAPHRAGPALPTSADAHLFFQAVVGAWPIDAERAGAYMQKATREAKLRTSWTDPDPDYDAAVESFVRGCLTDPAFVAEVERAVEPLVESGRRAALAQVALQLTAPGVPDLYQGSELWDLSLVDPDNRRPVDYERRRALLEEAASTDASGAWRRRDEGVAKLWLVHRALELRARRPEPFGAAHRPIPLAGERAAAGLAFARGDEVLTIVPRLVRRVERDGWGDTTLELPPGRWRALDGAEHERTTRVGDLLRAFPVAILERVA